VQAAEQHFNDIHKSCNDLKSTLVLIATSNSIKHVAYYVTQANDHIESIQQLVNTVYSLFLDKQDTVTAMKMNMNRMVSDFDDDEEE
jgi:predicted transcriptional regulator YdeE